MKKFIIIAGNIGAGKSTLVKQVCRKTSWLPYYEPVTENPYLKDFYADMDRWAFHSQLFFLSDRMAMHHDLQNSGISVVQDRSIYEDAEIFARNLYNQGKMSERDFATYWKMYRTATEILQAPDLLVYLKASVDSLLQRIQNRNRNFEADIPRTYLEQLNQLYDEWTESFSIAPKLVLDIEGYDILGNTADLDMIVDRIEQELRAGQNELF